MLTRNVRHQNALGSGGEYKKPQGVRPMESASTFRKVARGS